MSLESEVRAARGRLTRSAVVSTGVKGTLYAAIAAAGYLLIARRFGWPIEASVAALIIPLAFAAGTAVRGLSLRHAAAAIDRTLHLDERVVTAFEGPSGTFGRAAIEDATAALGRSDARAVGRLTWPVEARFLVPAMALVALLLMIPRSQAAMETPDRAVSIEAEIEALQKAIATAPTATAVEARRILEALRSSDPAKVRDAAIDARRMAVALRLDLAKGAAADREALRELADRLDAAGAGASRQMSHHQADMPEVAPVDIEARILAAKSAGGWGASSKSEPFEVVKITPGAWVAPDSVPTVIRRLEEKAWDRRYDDIVRRYYERRN